MRNPRFYTGSVEMPILRGLVFPFTFAYNINRRGTGAVCPIIAPLAPGSSPRGVIRPAQNRMEAADEDP